MTLAQWLKQYQAEVEIEWQAFKKEHMRKYKNQYQREHYLPAEKITPDK